MDKYQRTITSVSTLQENSSSLLLLCGLNFMLNPTQPAAPRFERSRPMDIYSISTSVSDVKALSFHCQVQADHEQLFVTQSTSTSSKKHKNSNSAVEFEKPPGGFFDVVQSSSRTVPADPRSGSILESNLGRGTTPVTTFISLCLHRQADGSAEFSGMPGVDLSRPTNKSGF